MRGFEVDAQSEARRAIDPIQNSDAIDLVLIEWIVNEKDSVDVVTRLRLGAGRNAVIVLLADIEPAARELQGALIAGADDYLVKPFTSRQLDEKLARAGFGREFESCSDRTGHPCR